MMTFPRRAASFILALALVSGVTPLEAAAQVARVVAVETGSMPVSPVATGVSLGSGLNASPALGAATLNGSLSAPSVAPSLAALGSPASVVNAAATPVAIPSAGVPALSFAVLSPAAKDEAPKDDKVDAAKTPAPVAAAKPVWRRVLDQLLSKKPLPPSAEKSGTESVSVEKAATDGGAQFDGSAAKTGETAGPVAGAESKSPNLLGRLKSGAQVRFQKEAEKRALHVDEFGGPKAVDLTFKQRVGYGLRQGLNLIGIGALLDFVVQPLLSLWAWPQYLNDQALHGFGRVALLTKFGPNEIVTGLANAPGTFLGVTLPMAVTMEEISYRLLGFGLTFLMLAAIRPVSKWLSGIAAQLPDAAGAATGVSKFLALASRISSFAFPIAAVYSAWGFASAHLALWGFSPYVLLLNFIVAMVLSHAAYKTRGLTAPIVAHLTFNLATMGVIWAALAFSPMVGAMASLLLGLVGVAALFHQWLTSRKVRKFRAGAGASALVALLIAGASLGVLSPSQGPTLAGHHVTTSPIVRVQEKKTETGITSVGKATGEVASAVPALADSAKVESRADMVARVKPSVVNVIVHVSDGMMIGSGFILTPDGVFITNGHVVGDKQPGQFVNAKVPGVEGELRAKVLAVNHDKDLAIVQLQPRPDGKPWPTVKLASVAPREGEEVTALGYPRGLPFTVSHGVVSGLDGRGNMYVKKLQTDAAINPGNSGGPLFNDKGEVIGVNTEIFTKSGGSEGLGFSIMAPEVGHVMAQYYKTGNIATAALGIISNLSDPATPDAGLQIEYVRPGSAAEKAGLRRNDLIIGVGDQVIEEGGMDAAGHVAAALSKLIPGQKVTVTVLRGDQPVEIEVTVDAKVTTAPQE